MYNGVYNEVYNGVYNRVYNGVYNRVYNGVCNGIYNDVYNGVSFSHKKEWSPVICSNVDGTGGNYVKWNKTDTKLQIHCTHIYLWKLLS